MEFIAGAICGIVLAWWVIVTWVRPKTPLKYIIECDRCDDFTFSSNDYTVVKYVSNAHNAWHDKDGATKCR